MAVWGGVMGPFAPHGPAVEAGHLRRNAGFVDEDELRRVPCLGPLFPILAPGGDIVPVLFGSSQCLFLYVNPMRRRVLSTVAMVQSRWQAAAISARVAPGWALM